MAGDDRSAALRSLRKISAWNDAEDNRMPTASIVVRASALAFFFTALASPALAAPPSKEECVEAHGKGQDARDGGHLARASKLFLTCAQAACPDLVRSDCARFADELSRIQPTVTFAAIAAAPEHRDAKNALGVILVHQGHFDEAIKILKPLTEDLVYASPESAWGNLGWAYFQRGSVDEALDALRRAVAVQPLFCVGQYRLGLAYEKKGDLGSARDALTKAVETDQPQCKRLQDAFSARARVFARQGLRDEARADLERCRDLSRETPVGQKCAAQLQTYQ
jgi:tetratricopeptide (TPR) repeat protein